MLETVERHMLAPFVWGESDCCLAACNVLAALGWPDPAAAYRGRYSDEASARAVMGGTVEDVAARETRRLGWPEIKPASARDGDVGVIAHSLAIHCGGWWMVKSEDGFIAKRRARRAWRPK